MQLTYDIVERNTMGDPKMEFTYKKLCIYSYMFKLQSPSNYSPFDAIQLLKFFFYCSEQFSDPSILKLFSASAIFCFTSSTSTKRFPLRTFFISGNKNIAWGEIVWIGRVGHRGHAIFGQKLLNTQHSLGRCTCKLPIVKWANTWKESSQKLPWSWTQTLTATPAGALIQMGS